MREDFEVAFSLMPVTWEELTLANARVVDILVVCPKKFSTPQSFAVDS
jgi:hypothetical protein